jgi:hypothetical protein
MAWVVAGVIFGVGGWVGEGKVLGGEREEEKKWKSSKQIHAVFVLDFLFLK